MSPAKKQLEPGFTDEILPRIIRAIITAVDLALFAGLLVAHHFLEILILWAVGREHESFRDLLSLTTRSAIYIVYLGLWWELVLLFLPQGLKQRWSLR